MKTTLELPDELFREAKMVAAKRRTTLRALIEHALRRELNPGLEAASPDPEKFEIGPLGLLVLKRRAGRKPMTLEDIRKLEEELGEQEVRRAMGRRTP